MPNTTKLVQELDILLEPGCFQDSAINGLQVDGLSTQVIRTIASAVDAGESVIERAISLEAQLLIVHHGLFWGKERPITGALARKIAALQRGGCSLYASHLPLDAHLIHGNNALLAKLLGLSDIKQFAEYKGQCIGVSGEAPTNTSINDLKIICDQLTGSSGSLTLPFGPSKIERVAVVSGSGTDWIKAAADAGISTFITGEPKQSAYHEAKELRINLICAGHYATETLGVRSIADLLATRHGLKHQFIDEPTGI